MARNDYPAELKYQSGNKVDWRFYDSFDNAQKAAAVAREDAKEQRSQGYDFGYHQIGAIETSMDEHGHAIYRVTCP